MEERRKRLGRGDKSGKNKTERFSRKDKPERSKTERFSQKDRPERSRTERFSQKDKPGWDKTERFSGKNSTGPQKKKFSRNPGRFPAKKENKQTESLKEELIRLNKFIADAGICSRREADTLITAGVITVNGKVVTQLGTRVSPFDKVQYNGQTLNREKLRYVLLNKPKGFITTTDDPKERKTVMSLIADACRERIYPVGRLDRNTTGLLLFTNDGNLAKKLTHPKHRIRKVYHVVLENNLTHKEMEKILNGIELEDGFIKVDAIDYAEDGLDKKQIGVELHSGKYHVVRRIFESLEHKVVKLDRVVFAGLTKKNLPRGTWRFLEEKEVSFLKMIS